MFRGEKGDIHECPLFRSQRPLLAGWRKPTQLAHAEGPVRRPKNWLDWVNHTLTRGELEALRQCVTRGSPYGTLPWAERMASRLGLESTLRPPGRPRKEETKKRKS